MQLSCGTKIFQVQKKAQLRMYLLQTADLYLRSQRSDLTAASLENFLI